MATRPNSTESILLYESQDGTIRLDVRMDDETVWLSLDQMATLFGKSRTTINYHVLNVYADEELPEVSTKRKIENLDFSTKPTNFYNLDVIISVGYRVKSQQGTRFRQWTDDSRTHLLSGLCRSPSSSVATDVYEGLDRAPRPHPDDE